MTSNEYHLRAIWHKKRARECLWADDIVGSNRNLEAAALNYALAGNGEASDRMIAFLNLNCGTKNS